MLEDEENDGFLIGLDLAIKLGREKTSEAPKKKKRALKSIRVLYGEEHSFMHDLESFFWVLFWVCVHWNWARQNQEGRVT